MTLLKTSGVYKTFGGIVALENVDLEIDKGSIIGLIGPNGAGKTTLFNVITGFMLPDKGEILFKEQSIKGEKPYKICERGIARTFQKARPFLNTTVRQSVVTGGFCRTGNMKKAGEWAHEIIEYLGLSNKQDYLVSDITLAEQRFVELAKALATQPEILFLDEVLAGLNPEEIKGMTQKLREINQKGITIILIEHVMSAVMNLSEWIFVLDNGRIIAKGYPNEIASNKDVIKAYLGVEYHA